MDNAMIAAPAEPDKPTETVPGRVKNAGGDPRLSDEAREHLIALTADSSFSEYLDEFCSDDLLTPIQ